jgi:hypothetical protein
LLSHIGLLSLVVGYCIMGAFIFQEVEKYNELETKCQMKAKRLYYILTATIIVSLAPEHIP